MRAFAAQPASTAARAPFLPIRAAWRFLLLIVTPAPGRFEHGVQFAKLTEGAWFERSLAEFRATGEGAALLSERPDSLSLLRDRAALANRPVGSLGRYYGAFLSAEGLEGEAYFAAVRASCADEPDAARAWYRERAGLMHDLRHMITGYGPTPLGEACLLAFRFAQTRHRGLVALLLLAMLVALAGRARSVFPAVAEAYRRGRRARSIDLLLWENHLDVPLAAHRARLGLEPPERYAPSIAPEAYLARGGQPHSGLSDLEAAA